MIAEMCSVALFSIVKIQQGGPVLSYQKQARLYLSPSLFVQVYRNDRFDTTNLALIHNNRRIFGRDELRNGWHRHPSHDPAVHDVSTEGRRDVTLVEFLDEAEAVLSELGLP